MINTSKYNGIVWIDLENPTSDEARSLVTDYNINPIIADELLSPTIRPRVDVHKDYIYLILHFPAAYAPDDEIHAVKDVEEVDFIIGKDFIITTRYDSVDALHEFSKVFEVKSILDRGDMGNHAGFIFYYMIQNLYKTMNSKVENIRGLLDDAEDRIFHGEEKQMVAELSKINRLLLTFKESVSMHREILLSFEIVGQDFFGTEFKHHLRSILGEYFKTQNAINNTKEYLNELRKTNDSLLSTKQNEIMKVLTIMAFITFPLSLVASIFGMNTIETPIVGHPQDFWTIVLLMLSLTLLMFIFFKKKRWL